MRKIEEYNETSAALYLMDGHTIGDLRDEDDLEISKYHASLTIAFIEDFLINIDGTVEEKIEFISKIKKEIPKFSRRVKEEEDDLK